MATLTAQLYSLAETGAHMIIPCGATTCQRQAHMGGSAGKKAKLVAIQQLLLTMCVVSADIDAFDLEVACDDPVKLVDILVALEPTFGGVNLEDIKVMAVAAYSRWNPATGGVRRFLWETGGAGSLFVCDLLFPLPAS